MALHRKVDFAAMCGVDSANISMQIKRQKIILTGKLIDDEVPQNKYFLEKNKLRKINSSDKLKSDIPLRSKEKRVSKTAESHSLTAMSQLDLQLKQLNIERQIEEIALSKIKKEKQMGIVIPTDLVKMLFSQHSKSISSSFKSATENLIIRLTTKYRLTREDAADIRHELIGDINTAVDASITETKKAIKVIVSEYSEIRGIGERK